MRLDEGWNQIQFNLSDFTRRAYGTNYIETLRVQVQFQKSYIYVQFRGGHFLYRLYNTVIKISRNFTYISMTY